MVFGHFEAGKVSLDFDRISRSNKLLPVGSGEMTTQGKHWARAESKGSALHLTHTVLLYMLAVASLL